MANKEEVEANDSELGYGLPDVFQALRGDLLKAKQYLMDSDGDPIMKLAGAEVEIAFTVERRKKGESGLNLRAFGVGFGAEVGLEHGDSTVHRIKINLDSAGDFDVLE
ncbi:hypothetical protein M2271_007244 [Streptomyces sp. LBL]|uniref:trypco2 family protein n=1 Tax=Streptomyces sp. LBL TaxID=2940562 RepID=UPI0024738B65|nr:trypco2 family protein [Streptomyces sp. LBL]MDH6629408.1 hypothetical protein [Streptomyces sp. LBL]